MKCLLNVKSQSVETSGIPKDYRDAICEYVWNGLEANATTITITHRDNELQGVAEVIIVDNGSGICYDTLPDTFGAFLASPKNALSLQIKSKANQGKGRFAGFSFAGSVKWDTVCENNGNKLRYSISVYSVNKNEYEISEAIPTDAATGTVVTIGDIDHLRAEQLSLEELENILLKEFSWYLYLNKDRNIKIVVGDKSLDYTKYVDTKFSVEKQLVLDGVGVIINVVVWKEKIGEKFCTYFMNMNGVLKGTDTTTFNRNTVDFYHSVFVRSLYFDGKGGISLSSIQDSEDSQISMEAIAQDRSFLRKLKSEIQGVINDVLKSFLTSQAGKAVQGMIDRKSFPIFSDDIQGHFQKKELITVTQELYKLEAKIFYKLKPIQEKSLLGFINLLLQSEERENILNIVESVVQLTPAQRKDFSDILQRTTLGNIVDTIHFIEDRYTVIEALKKVLFEYTEYANERDHIQRIVEQHYWLFGEQYNLVTADQRMQQALERYLNILYGAAADATLSPDQEKLRRMDIFLCGARNTEDAVGDTVQENLIIELKAPKVVLSKKVLRQIEDYMDFIRRQPQFNTQLCRWKFIAVCNTVDDDVRSRYAEKQATGKKGLVLSLENYEIYALTWADVFKSFDLRHSFLLNKLKIDQAAIEKELTKEIGNRTGREAVTHLSADILQSMAKVE